MLALASRCGSLPLAVAALLRRLIASNRGVAGTEFALVVPVLLVLLLGGYELSRAIGAATRATYMANGLAELVSQATLELSERDLNRIIETAPLLNPDIIDYAREANRDDFWNVAEIVISSVQYAPLDPDCETACTYQGDMIFSHASKNATPRSCGPAAAAALLPPEVAGKGSLIVVEVAVPYEATFADIAVLPMRFERTVYLRPRYVERIESHSDCPGH